MIVSLKAPQILKDKHTRNTDDSISKISTLPPAEAIKFFEGLPKKQQAELTVTILGILLRERN